MLIKMSIDTSKDVNKNLAYSTCFCGEEGVIFSRIKKSRGFRDFLMLSLVVQQVARYEEVNNPLIC
jgi:hypothetical protein